MINNLQSILTQDNRITSDPIFLVQGWERIFVEDGEFITYVENETGDYCEMSQEDFSNLEDLYLEAEYPCRATVDNGGEEVVPQCPEDPVLGGNFDPDNWERREYILRPVFMTACFTEKAAQDYLDCNGHNAPRRQYKAPRIYVESGWRNKEWQQIRQLLIDKARIEGEDITA